ncbi:phage tail protein, partial [Salmonella enterica]|nr:phage tail protein [Salmonella enterica]
MGQLHGVETIELAAGTVAVTTIETAIIGVVGTAPQAAGAVAATLTAGTPLLGNELTFTAKKGGRSGNTIRVIAELPQPPAKGKGAGAVPTSAKWENGRLLITLGCSEEGAGNATVSDVVTAVNGVADVGVSATGSGDGVVSPFSGTLSGGEDEPFPLNTPVAMAGATALSRLGNAGTLKQALTEINDQRNALSVIVRVEEKTKPEEQRAALLAGISVLSSAKSVTTYQPRIVIAPGFSEDDAVGKALETVAGKLRAV